MAYNLTDMFWVGVDGIDSVAAVGIAGFYIWFSMAFTILVRVGTEVRVAHRTGAGDDEDAKNYARSGIHLAIGIALIYATVIYLSREFLIGFFQTDAQLHKMSVDYLSVALIAMIFSFINPIFTAIFNARGKSGEAFRTNLVGLAMNIVLDPIMILGYGLIPGMGVVGAAWATVISQAVVSFIFARKLFVQGSVFQNFSFWKPEFQMDLDGDGEADDLAPYLSDEERYSASAARAHDRRAKKKARTNADKKDRNRRYQFTKEQLAEIVRDEERQYNERYREENYARMKDILSLGVSPAMHSAFFTITAIIIGRMVSGFGTNANAVQKLGTQIESLSWMTANGIGSALTAFIGQNYGSSQMDRVKEGYRWGLVLSTGIGVIVTLILFFMASPLFMIFTRDGIAIEMGADYLRILALSQFFMCIEIMSAGVFNGLGKTKPPAVIGMSFNFLRIPLSALLITTPLGLNGIWWAISMTSVFKGTIAYIVLKRHLHKISIA